MENEHPVGFRAARRAYELGRLRVSLLHGMAGSALAAGVAAASVGWRALVWVPLTLLVWTAVEWRGTWLMRGARRGFWAGLVTLLLPLSVLRPCCRPGMDISSDTCCTMPEVCVAVGAFVGLSLAVLVPKAPNGHRVITAVGMGLGVLAVAALRCAPLLLGEAAGLLGGLLAGVFAANIARAWTDRQKAPG